MGHIIFSDAFLSTESEWLKWWNEVGILQMESTATLAPQVTPSWNVSFSVDGDNEQTETTGTTMKWNMTFTDVITGQL